MIKEIIKIVDELSADENLVYNLQGNIGGPHSLGCKNQRQRLKRICEKCLKMFDGDILEIGCHIGLTTKIFCELAKKYNRKVTIIDPWNGQQQGGDNEFKQFTKNTEPYTDILNVNRVSSLSEEGKNIIENGNYCFCWVDGLHTYEACGQDIDSCSKHKVIAVDDIRWLADLQRVFKEKTTEHNFKSYHNQNCREGYYVNID